MSGYVLTQDQDKKHNQVTGERLSASKYALHVIAETSGIVYDTITATYPTTSSEVYTYTLAAVTVRVVTVTYTDATKEVLSSIVRS